MSKISVIIPVYNVEKYLKECVFSVLTQSFKEFEIVLIDDGSTDNSGKICDEFALDHAEKIIVIHKQNQGQFIARIVGIQNAHSDIVVFLDSDDSLREDALEIIYQSFQEHKCDMLLFDTGVCDNYQCSLIKHTLDDTSLFCSETKSTLFKKLILKQIPNSICLKAFRFNKNYLEDYFLKILNIKHGEDLLMTAYLFSKCQKIKYIDQGLYYYRVREGSITNTFDFQRKEALKIVHTELEKCIDLCNISNLKSLHNARKISGWIENLLMLIKNKHFLSSDKFKNLLKDMAEDSYFVAAYSNMDSKKLSKRDRFFAYCLFKRQYLIFHIIAYAYPIVKKFKFR